MRDAPPMFHFDIVEARPCKVGVRHDGLPPIFEGSCVKFADGTKVVPNLLGDDGAGTRFYDGWQVTETDGRVRIVR